MVRKISYSAAGLLLSGSLLAHTLYIKPESFFVAPHADVTLPLINGTFIDSANRVTTSMMHSVTVVDPDGRQYEPDEEQWSYDGKVSYLKVGLGSPGNYVVGVETRPRKVILEPEVFNYYLRYEGLWDDRDEREALQETELGVTERYIKYTKAILQAGDDQSDSYATELGYEVEIIPLVNPYRLQVGDTFRARILKQGEPLTGELVYATHEGHYLADDEGIFDEAVKTRSNGNGVIEFDLTAPGRWYVRFINLNRMDEPEYWYTNLLVMLGVEDERVFYQSRWATLTFEIH